MRRENPWARLITGLAILAFGVILWLDHLHKIRASEYLQWWGLVLIVFGIVNFAERRWLGGAIMTFIGLAVLPNIPVFPHFHVSQILGLWPLLISAAGATLVIQAMNPAVVDPRAARFKSVAVMGGSGRVISANEIVAGDVVAVMGGTDITIASDVREAVIDVLVFWGGAEIKVPRGWRVESHVAVIMGALVSKTIPVTSSDAPKLVLRGSVIMGGIEVRHPKEESV
jgi:hypothetical protein